MQRIDKRMRVNGTFTQDVSLFQEYEMIGIVSICRYPFSRLHQMHTRIDCGMFETKKRILEAIYLKR